LHRISGFILFLLIPLLLWMAHSASTAAGFMHLQDCFRSPVLKFFVWAMLAALSYHLLAGIKHLLMDSHVLSEDLKGARAASKVVIILAVVLSIIGGVWIW
jgi:succinate dehydrogenase / fumarate reductase cytochrome b subunit